MPIKPAAAALNQTPIDWLNNVNNIIYAIEQAKKEGANLLITPEMSITGGEFTVGITDADDRTSIKPIRGHPLVLHPASVNNTILVLTAKPIVAAEFCRHIKSVKWGFYCTVISFVTILLLVLFDTPG